MTEAEDTIALIAALLQKGEEFCVATVVRTENATSAKAGAKAVVLADGTIKGFLGGGCVQRAIRRASEAVLREGEPRLIRVKPKDDVAVSVDVDGTELHRSACPSGGTVDMFIEPLRRAPRIVVSSRHAPSMPSRLPTPIENFEEYRTPSPTEALWHSGQSS